MVPQKFTNADFLRSLIQAMTAKDPEERPTAKGALAMWVETRTKVSMIRRVWRPHPGGEDVREAAVQDVISLFNASRYCARAVFERLWWW